MTIDGREDKICTVATLDFRDDDGKALLILLRLAHSKTKSIKTKGIPSKIPYELFLNIAILVDQYDCINLIRPWLFTWNMCPEIQQSRMQPGWLFIA